MFRFEVLGFLIQFIQIRQRMSLVFMNSAQRVVR